MQGISTSQTPTLSFSPTVSSRPFQAQSAKIGWLRAQAKPGATFDLTIKDGLGRTKLQKLGCKAGSGEYGELVNLPTNLGEKLDVCVENVRGTDLVSVFLN